MGLILYNCSDDFPERIPELLAKLSPTIICEGGPENNSDFELGYKYKVAQGRAKVLIYGCREDDSMSVAIVDGSLSLLGGRARMQLAADVTTALVDAGMREVTVEEVMEFEVRRKQKQAESDRSED